MNKDQIITELMAAFNALQRDYTETLEYYEGNGTLAPALENANKALNKAMADFQAVKLKELADAEYNSGYRDCSLSEGRYDHPRFE